jgi:hypothetical protein
LAEENQNLRLKQSAESNNSIALCWAIAGEKEVKMRPFSGGDTYATFQNLTESIANEIDNLSNEYVLKASVTELEKHFVDKGTLDPFVLHSDRFSIVSQTKSSIDVSGDWNRAGARRGRRIEVPGTTLSIGIPCEGDSGLLRLRPSTFSLSPYPEIEVSDGELVFQIRFADDTADAEKIRRDIDRNVAVLVDAVSRLAHDVEGHNSRLPSVVTSAIERKRKKALAATDAIAALGIPISRRGSPATYAIPTRRRPRPVARPKVARDRYEPEPELAMEEYDHILEVMSSMALVIERNPKSFAGLNEEAIRDHFLIQLNGHYEGGATGETFNASGKTDILIREGDRNVFVAECKFWHGPKGFDSAVAQLLGYLTWRDSKTALLVFSRNKDSSSVRRKMHETITARPEFRSTISTSDTGDSRYVLIKVDEPGREILLTTQLYIVGEGSNGDSG